MEAIALPWFYETGQRRRLQSPLSLAKVDDGGKQLRAPGTPAAVPICVLIPGRSFHPAPPSPGQPLSKVSVRTYRRKGACTSLRWRKPSDRGADACPRPSGKDGRRGDSTRMPDADGFDQPGKRFDASILSGYGPSVRCCTTTTRPASSSPANTIGDIGDKHGVLLMSDATQAAGRSRPTLGRRGVHPDYLSGPPSCPMYVPGNGWRLASAAGNPV